MHRWLDSLNAIAVNFDDAQAFINVNTIPDTDQRVA
jgi:molybdopterin-guanine dinucleotide biosynthesis protein A